MSLPEFNTTINLEYVSGPFNVAIGKEIIFTYAFNAEKLKRNKVALSSPKTLA